MSLMQLMPQLTTLRDERPGNGNAAWKVLYPRRRQPLLVPLDSRQAQEAVGFFIRNPVLRWWGRLLLTLDKRVARGRLLDTVQLESFPSRVLFGTANIEETALYCGFPGPLQKLTIYYPGHDGDLGKVAKIALNPSADEAIAQEAHWLYTLGCSQPTADFMPRLLQQGTLPCGRRFLAMLALPQGRPCRRFTELHRNFLRVLSRQRPPLTPWAQSELYRRLDARLHSLMPILTPAYRDLMQSVLDEINQNLGARSIPTCLGHCDFTPWNVRIADNRLFVFDWEYTEANSNPLHDFLHFHLIQRALQRWPLRTGAMPKLVSQAAAYADDVFGEESGVAEAAGMLTLHYLLDILTFYAAASGKLVLKHPVMRLYLKLLAERGEWLAPSSIGGSRHEYVRQPLGG